MGKCVHAGMIPNPPFMVPNKKIVRNIHIYNLRLYSQTKHIFTLSFIMFIPKKKYKSKVAELKTINFRCYPRIVCLCVSFLKIYHDFFLYKKPVLSEKLNISKWC